jgi:two-component system response regulator DesR
MTLRILVADDAAAVRGLVRALLTRTGFDVVAEAGSGPEAIEAAQAAAPDVAVLDLTMPGLDGIDATRAMAVRGVHPAVVLLTYVRDGYQVVRALRAGVRGYVVKAEAPEYLEDAIRSAAKGHVLVSPLARQSAADFIEEHEGVLSVRDA